MVPDTDDEETGLWTAFRSDGSLTARERLFSRHAAFARNIARRHHRERSRGDIDLADLYQLAYAGLLEALDRYNPEQGVSFRHYAAHRISGSILDGIERMSEVREQMSWRRRAMRDRLRSLSEAELGQLDAAAAMAKLAEIATGLALGFMLEGTGLFDRTAEEEGGSHLAQATAYDTLTWKEIVAELHAELSALAARERIILRQHYIAGMGFDQLASMMAISKGRVSQIHREALAKLRKRMRVRGHMKLGGVP